MIKKIMLFLLAGLIVIQFIRPAKNETSGASPYHISAKYPVSASLNTILQKACTDCHSNHTVYPWYSKVQPVYWWLNSHIKDGKRHLNFDEFTNLPAWKQYHKLEEIEKEVQQKDMPLNSYTWVHKNAVLTDAEKTEIYNWITTSKTAMETQYPRDSLVRPKK